MKLTILTVGAFFAACRGAFACSVCYGAASGKPIDGMNMAILSMLGIVGLMLSAFGTFFWTLRKRSKLLAQQNLSCTIHNEQGSLE